MSEIQAYSIFYENFRTGNYEMALQFGRWMIDNKPMEIEGANRFSLPRQFERMIDVYANIAGEQSDPTLRTAYLDTAATIYEQAFSTFDEETIDYYEWYFNRGRFFQEHNSRIDNGLEKAYADYEAAYELDPERLTNSGDGYYINILLRKYVNDGDREKALAMIDTVEPFASTSLAESIEETRNDLFSDPEERITFLESRLESNPEDEALISELASLYEGQSNRQKAIEYAEMLYEVNSNFENTRKLADYAKADAQYEKALRYLQEALEKTDENRTKRNIALEIAETYQNNNNLRSAREFAREAIRYDGNWGEPYIRIASIYAAAVTECTSGRTIDRDDRTVYWLVLDYLDKARSVDSSAASAVQRRYRTYEPVLPSSEDKFFRGWETGDEINIGSNISDCYTWIGETTNVR
ncbi:MAG: hypothetical protein WEA56_05530 [Balneolaceae bacterium]